MALQQEQFQQEDSVADQIYAFMEGFTGDKICSKQIYREALNHPYEEPKQWELREIREIVNQGIASGAIQGWRAFPNSRRFEKYGTQRGWERVPASTDAEDDVNKPVDRYEQLGFTVIEKDDDLPF